MDKKEANILLTDHGLKRTPARKAVLELFMEREAALSHSEVQEELGDEADRVTLYRTLKSFEEKGIIHEVLGPDGVVKYALCSDGCAEAEHKDEHAHFHCRRCGNTYCLEDVEVPGVKAPKGFKKEEEAFYLKGICAYCSP